MIKEIEIKGKKYPVKIAYWAISRLQLETGMTTSDIKNNMSLLEPLFYYSIEAGCKETGQTFDIKREDVPWLLDDLYIEYMNLFTNFFPSVQESSDLKKKMS